MWLTLLLLIARVTGVLFIFSGVSKLMARDTFAASLRGLPFLPSWGIGPVATALPWVEVVLGSVMVMGLLTLYAVLIALALLFIFSLVAIAALARGLDVPCACFGAASRAPLSWWTVGRNVLFALLLFPIVIINHPSPLSVDAILSGPISSRPANRSLIEVAFLASLPVCAGGVAVLMAIVQRTLGRISTR